MRSDDVGVGAGGIDSVMSNRALDDVGANSLASDVGTVYKKTEVSCSVEDPSAFRDFVEQNSNWAAIDLRANKTFVREMMEKEGSTPPGIKVTTMVNVGVRRS